MKANTAIVQLLKTLLLMLHFSATYSSLCKWSAAISWWKYYE